MSCDWMWKLNALVLRRAKVAEFPVRAKNINTKYLEVQGDGCFTAVAILQLWCGPLPPSPFPTEYPLRQIASYALIQQRLNTACPDARLISGAIAHGHSSHDL